MSTSVVQDPKDAGALFDWFEERPINKEYRKKVAQATLDSKDAIGLDWAFEEGGKATGKTVKMLDYACGGGFLSKIFAPYISSITAIDITPSMISRYNLSRTNGAITPEKSSAMVGNLLSSPPDPASLADKQFYDFDLITVGAALHHFPSSADALRILAARLAPDGVLLIQDLFDARTPDSDGELPPEPKNRPTGFAKQGLGSMMESAGLQDFRMEVFAETFKIELPSLEVMEFQCFVASAKKPV